MRTGTAHGKLAPLAGKNRARDCRPNNQERIMNSMTVRRINAFVPALLLGLSAVARFAACHAGDLPRANTAPAPSITVHYDDVNLASPKGVQQLYARIVAAAQQVCDAGGQRTLLQFEKFRACFGPSVTRAVGA